MTRAVRKDELVLRGKRRWWIIPTIILGLVLIYEVSEMWDGIASWDQYVMLPFLAMMLVTVLVLIRTIRMRLSPFGIRLQWHVGIKVFPIYAMDWEVPWSCFYSVERFDFLKWLDIPPRGVLLHGRLDGRGVLVSLSTLTTDFGRALAFAVRHVDPEIVAPEVLELLERYQ